MSTNVLDEPPSKQEELDDNNDNFNSNSNSNSTLETLVATDKHCSISPTRVGVLGDVSDQGPHFKQEEDPEDHLWQQQHCFTLFITTAFDSNNLATAAESKHFNLQQTPIPKLELKPSRSSSSLSLRSLPSSSSLSPDWTGDINTPLTTPLLTNDILDPQTPSTSNKNYHHHHHHHHRPVSETPCPPPPTDHHHRIPPYPPPPPPPKNNPFTGAPNTPLQLPSSSSSSSLHNNLISTAPRKSQRYTQTEDTVIIYGRLSGWTSTKTASALLFLYGHTYRGGDSSIKLGKLLDHRRRCLFKDKTWSVGLLLKEEGERVEGLVGLLREGGFRGVELHDGEEDAEFVDGDDGRGDVPQGIWDMLACGFAVDPNAVLRYGLDGGVEREVKMEVDEYGQVVYQEFMGGRHVHEGYEVEGCCGMVGVRGVGLSGIGGVGGASGLEYGDDCGFFEV